MDGYDDLPPAEAARQRRRDRDAEAEKRAGMRSGLAKQFKQVLDAQVKRARADDAPPNGGPTPGGGPAAPVGGSRRKAGSRRKRGSGQPPKVNE